MSTPLGSSQWMYSSGEEPAIGQSLKFNDDESQYLSWTPAAAGNRKTWTWSGWVKRGNIGTTQDIFIAGSNASGQLSTQFTITSGNILQIYSTISGSAAAILLQTTQVFRDVSAWYHIVLQANTTDGTASNRVKLYVNGEQVTSFSTATYPSQNYDTAINNNVIHTLGRFSVAAANHFDGYLSDIHFIDGQALDPTDFGETIDGYWRAIRYAGTYGTNGFHLDLNGNTNDASGNGNDWTANNISAHDYVPDSPTNNFATLNVLTKGTSNITLAEGNLKANAIASGSGGNWGTVFSSITLPTTGKYYVEGLAFINAGVGNNSHLGVLDTSSFAPAHNNITYAYTTGEGFDGIYVTLFNNYAQPVSDGVLGTAEGSLTGTTVVAMLAVDIDNGKVWAGYNGTWLNSGNPSAGTNEIATRTFSDSDAIAVGTAYSASNAQGMLANFGQDSTFSGATTAGGNTDANGIGDFKYPVPAGYLSLCSASLPIPTIVDGSEYFVPYLYTADNTSPRSFTGLGFEPDVLWFKTRSQSFSHRLFNSTVGVGSHQYTDRTDNATWNSLVSFDADGFTVEADGTAGNLLNYSTSTYVAWAWKTGTTVSGNTTGAGTAKAYTGSVNTDSGISVISYKGNGTAGHTIPHHLGKAPSMVMTKKTTATGSFGTYHSGLTSASYYILLNATTGEASNNVYFNGTAPDATVVTRGTGADGNANDVDYVQFSFAEIDGYSKIGKWVGNGSSDGPMVFTGFRPSFILAKKSSASGDNWTIYDTARDPYNVTREYLIPNSGQTAASTDTYDILSNGFKIRTSGAWVNTSGATYIYLAFAETPFKHANAR